MGYDVGLGLFIIIHPFIIIMQVFAKSFWRIRKDQMNENKYSNKTIGINIVSSEQFNQTI